MTPSATQTLRQALLRILHPLVRVMLKHGIAYGDFAEIARTAFVQESFDYMRQAGRRPTISGVSALTGLTRKEARRLLDLAKDPDTEISHRYNRATRVISGWVEDPDYQDGTGEPAALDLEGEAGSFEALVRKYSGDVPYTAMLAVLENSGTVAARDGRVTLLQRAYIPRSTPADKLDILGTDAAELIATIDHNLDAAIEDRHFQRKVSSHLVRAESLAEFRAYSNARSQQLLEEYDHWLSTHEVEAGNSDAESACYVAIGIYYTDSGQENSHETI